MDIRDYFPPSDRKHQHKVSPPKDEKIEDIDGEPVSQELKKETFKKGKRTLVKKKPVIHYDVEDDDFFDDVDEETLKALEDEPEVIVSSNSKNTIISDDEPISTKRKNSITEESPKKVKRRNSPASSPRKLDSYAPKTATPKKQIPKKEIKQSAIPKSSSSSIEELENKPAKKFNYREYLAKKAAIPKAAGTKEIPEGKENCFEGLTFVFTGELTSLSRDEAADIVKRYGGRVTSAPSSRTTYVVVGEMPGEKKMEKIKQIGIPTVDEDEFLNLIIKKSEELDSVPESATKKAASIVKKEVKKEMIDPVLVSKAANHSQLWIEKYRPKTPEEFIGNQSNLTSLANWLKSWDRESPSVTKAALISGPPGIGKTTASHLISKLNGYIPIEFNASDTRSKKSLKENVKELSGSHTFFDYGVGQKPKGKTLIIMDEVDGMSSGDRGGMAELIQVIKKSKIPIICICNDRSSPKVRSLANYCLDLRFRRPDGNQVAKRLISICESEGLHVKPNVIQELVRSTQADIRQILNILSSWKRTRSSMDYDEAKSMCVDSKKDFDTGPFDIVTEFLSGSRYASSNVAQKLDFFFTDSSLNPLMVQENYIKCTPSYAARNVMLKQKSYLDFLSMAAESISYSDVVDGHIHGTNQDWSLSPFFGFTSCVLPGFFAAGGIGGRIDFPSWLGQNSKAGKYHRILKEISLHSSLKIPTSARELRLSYMPTIYQVISTPLVSEGTEGIHSVIDFLDSYDFLKEDFDAIFEFSFDGPKLWKSIPTKVKSALTRTYNKESHALPFSVSDVKSSAKQSIVTVVPDDAEIEEESEEDISKDEMVKVKSAKTEKPRKKASKK